MDDISEALRMAISRRREELGLTYRKLAAEMAAAGCPGWKGSTVADIERRDKTRRVQLNELPALCAALRCGLDDLLRDVPQAVERLHGSARGTEDDSWSQTADEAYRQELREHLEVRLSSALGITISDLLIASGDLYGTRDVLAVRDAKLGDAPVSDPQGRAQRLGHATRQMHSELADYLAEVDPSVPF